MDRHVNAVTISDVDAYVEPLGEDEPCGPDLEYDPEFLEFNQTCTSKPEEQYGDTITAEVPPEWKIVLQQARQLLERTRDLRICIPFTRALLYMQGLSGLAVGLNLIERLLEQHWLSVHPQLDPDDNYDPMMRVNILATLCDGTVLIRDIKDAAMLSSRVHGRVILRDIDIATGETEVAEDVAKPSLALIEAAFLEADLDEVKALHVSLISSCHSIARIEEVLTDNVGAAQSLNLAPLLKLVERARKYVAERLQLRTGGKGALAGADQTTDAVGADGAPAGPRHDRIADRDDVLRALEKICLYYEQNEPSSPVPLLLIRAQRLVTKNFLEIMEDLAPDGLNQVYSVSGTQSAS